MDEITIESWVTVYSEDFETLEYLDVDGGRLYRLSTVDTSRVETVTMTFAPNASATKVESRGSFGTKD